MVYQYRRRPERSFRGREGSKIRAALYVPAGGSRFRRHHEIRVTRTVIDIKVSTLDTDGGPPWPRSPLCKGRAGAAPAPRTGRVVLRRRGRAHNRVGEERYERGPGDLSSLRARWRTCGPTSGRGREGHRRPAARGRDRGVFRRLGEVGQHSGARRTRGFSSHDWSWPGRPCRSNKRPPSSFREPRKVEVRGMAHLPQPPARCPKPSPSRLVYADTTLVMPDDMSVPSPGRSWGHLGWGYAEPLCTELGSS